MEIKLKEPPKPEVLPDPPKKLPQEKTNGIGSYMQTTGLYISSVSDSSSSSSDDSSE